MDDFMMGTIYFDGQFWVALIEKSEQGNFFIGRYVFGPEPSNTDLEYFMLNRLSSVLLLPSKERVRKKKQRKIAETDRITGKSKLIYTELQHMYAAERKNEQRKTVAERKEQLYIQKQEKKKQKRRGH